MEEYSPRDRAALLKEKKIFCTECGTYLENFCFSSSAEDVDAIKKSIAQCRKKGKFVGDFCAKLFIGGSETLDSLWNDTGDDKPL
jgi:hypothetical protein